MSQEQHAPPAQGNSGSNGLSRERGSAEKQSHRKGGILQRLSRLMWRQKKSNGDRRITEKNGERQLPAQLHQETSPLPHVMHVNPAAATTAAMDLAGEAMGHQDGNLILPCYAAHVPLPGDFREPNKFKAVPFFMFIL